MTSSSSSSPEADVIALPADRRAWSRRFCSASRRRSRAFWTAAAAGTASSSARRTSSGLKRRGARVSMSITAPTTVSWKTSGRLRTLCSPQRSIARRAPSPSVGSARWYSTEARPSNRSRNPGRLATAKTLPTQAASASLISRAHTATAANSSDSGRYS